VSRGEEDLPHLLALIALQTLPGVGDRTLRSLLSRHGSPEEVLRLPDERFRRECGPAAAEALKGGRLLDEASLLLERCREAGAELLPIGSADYPAGLLALPDPPPLLYLQGDRTLLQRRRVAVVGARRATPSGRRVAERVGRELAAASVTVVSGLALGIDSAAHRGALSGEGSTIAVLGCGIDQIHPPGNRLLHGAIARGGLLLSELLPGSPPLPHHFPRRNRIIAGLSSALVVVEASRRSGALITVGHALDLGLDVFVTPGSIDLPQTAGSNELFREGAHLYLELDDLLFTLGWSREESLGRTPEVHRGSVSAADSILSLLTHSPIQLDLLVARTPLSLTQLLEELTRLEVAGEVERSAEGWARTR